MTALVVIDVVCLVAIVAIGRSLKRRDAAERREPQRDTI